MKRVKELPPIRETVSDYDKIEAEIKKVFREEFYKPLLDILKEPEEILSNAKDDALKKALQAGRVTFSYGTFYGRLTASISRQIRSLGATWDTKTATYKINLKDLPAEIQDVIRSSESKMKRKLARIDEKLSKILPEEIADKMKVTEIFEASLWKTNQSIAKTLKAISIPPELTPNMEKKIAHEYRDNLKLDIKKFTTKQVETLRDRVREHTFAGNRYHDLIKEIQASYGVTQNKAKFLARQETSLLMTKYKEAKYTEAGVLEYRWQCVVGSPKHPVRPRHKELNGTVHKWSEPPVTSEDGEPERRNNPGQDYNCRCVAIPIVRFSKAGK